MVKQLQTNVWLTIIPQSIIYCIAEYATGFKIKCNGTIIPAYYNCLNHNCKWKCDGFIYFLLGDNFNYNINFPKPNYNELGYRKYKCNNPICFDEFYVLKCNAQGCDYQWIPNKNDIFTMEYYNGICFNTRGYNNILCNKVYCDKHYKQNGLRCCICQTYYCLQCKMEFGFCLDDKIKKKYKIDIDWCCKCCIRWIMDEKNLIIYGENEEILKEIKITEKDLKKPQ